MRGFGYWPATFKTKGVKQYVDVVGRALGDQLALEVSRG